MCVFVCVCVCVVSHHDQRDSKNMMSDGDRFDLYAKFMVQVWPLWIHRYVNRLESLSFERYGNRFTCVIKNFDQNGHIFDQIWYSFDRYGHILSNKDTG